MNQRISEYQELIKKYTDLATSEGKRSFNLSLLRLAVLIATIAMVIVSLDRPLFLLIGIVGFGAILFVYIVMQQQRADRAKRQAEMAVKINENEINCLEHFENQYSDGSEYDLPKHYYTGDLDVFGQPSLFGLINRCRTYDGHQYLSQWLSQIEDRKTIVERQTAVQELEPMVKWRQRLANHLYTLQDHSANPADLLESLLQQDVAWADKIWIRIWSILTPLLWIGIGVLYYFDGDIGYVTASALAIANIGIMLYYGGRVSDVQGHLSAAVVQLSEYSDSLQHIMRQDYQSDYINQDLQPLKNTSEDGHPVSQLKELKGIIDRMDYRLNMIVGFLLNVFLLWDLRIIKQLGQWQSSNQDILHQVFGLIGKMEALSSLATWSYNHPEYQYAELSEASFELSGTEMGHPLLDRGHHVKNSFTKTAQDPITIITGSNMSGKSTFLRTVGVNMILAYAGTRVCASSLRTSVVQLISYMRIKDALEESVSTFKAELNRVEMILSQIRTGAPSLILIDEMLRGTNSKDKLKGSIGITKKLMESGAYAMIATHDIQLAELGRDYPDHIKNYYFDIDFEDGDLRFDYELKEGICENFNASYLISQLGIEME